jgi:ABC-type sugar transport system substrate-binding protein
MRPSSKFRLLVSAGLISASLAACGGGSSSNSTKSSGSDATGQKAAKAEVSQAMRAPSSIGVTTPLKTPAPKGKTFVYLRCDFAQCGYTEAGVQEAAKALHWNLRVIDFNAANPATLVAAMKQALAYHPVAVAFNGTPYATWSSVVPAYEKAHVAIIPAYVGPQPLNGAVVANLGNPADLAGQAKSLAAWMATDSGGTGKALVVGFPSLPAIGAFPQDFSSALHTYCPGCSITALNGSEADAANPTAINSLIVSSLQRDPSIKYVFVPDGGLVPGLPSAISGAGLSGVKIGGAQGTLENDADMKSGTEQAFTAQDFDYLGWMDLDTAARHLEGMPVSPGDGGLLTRLQTKANLGTPHLNLDEPSDYQQEFEKLWKTQ